MSDFMQPASREEAPRFDPAAAPETSQLWEAATAAHAALYSIGAGGLLDAAPSDPDDSYRHSVACTLLDMAERALRMALQEAGIEPAHRRGERSDRTSVAA